LSSDQCTPPLSTTPLPGAYWPSEGWAAACWVDPASWILGRIDTYLTSQNLRWDEVASIAVGATGIEDQDHGSQAAEALARVHPGVTWRVVNDAELVVPAADLTQGIGVICGTGSIVVSSDAKGRSLRVGGWGNLLGDEGSGAGLVRECLKATLRRDDAGEPAGLLAQALVAMSDVASIRDLAFDLCFQAGPTAWGDFAPAVFTAAESGDPDAQQIITQAGTDLAHQVVQVVRRGAVGQDVIIAGSVILRQPRLRTAFTATLAAECPDLRVSPLGLPPAHGALNLALRAR
jgi:N-acetylglucosamine kinase-like BadF-type ATPase